MTHSTDMHQLFTAKPASRFLLLVFILCASIAAFPAPIPAAALPPVYPISGYFVSASSSDAVNAQMLASIQAAGGDTAITFGSKLLPATLATVPADCKIGSENCAQAATTGIVLNRVFNYSDGNPWGTSAVTCPRDRSITSNGKPFTVLVLPTSGAGCDSANGSYDVVVVSGGNLATAGYSISMAKAATSLGMKFYAGMPIPANRTDLAFLPDLSYQNTFSLFTERFLLYQAAGNNASGLAGFYLPNEMPMSDGAIFDSILTVYRMQNQAIHRILPTRSVIVSPYLDARLAASGNTTPAKAAVAARNIAATAGGVQLSIAIQDGMGTGKGGAYFGNEAGSPVDPYAAVIVGAGTWGAKYLAPNRDYYLAAAAGVAGTGATLWANVEGMAPATGSNVCDTDSRGQTTKARLDRQLQQLSNAPKKVISFMWDTYYTCVGTGVPLAQQIQAGKATPLITDTTFNAGAGTVEVTGYNLSGAQVKVNWTTAAGQALSKTVAAGPVNPSFGQQSGLNPALQMVTANLGATSVAAGKYYTVDVTNAWGARNDAAYAKLG